MLQALNCLKGLLKQKSYHIDHLFFRLHSQVTVGLLLAFCLILTAKVLFGDVIDCKDRILERDNYYDNWCYSRGTFTEFVPDIEAYERAFENYWNQSTDNGRYLNGTGYTFVKPAIGYQTTEAPSFVAKVADAFGTFGLKVFFGETDDEPATEPSHPVPGVEVMERMKPPMTSPILKDTAVGDYFKTQFKRIHSFIRGSGAHFSQNIAYMIPGVSVPRGKVEPFLLQFDHTYYQYIPIILFLQAVFFYFPHYLWKCWENEVISSICKQLHENRFTPNDYFDTNYHIVDYLRNVFFVKKTLVYKYYCCHLMLLANLIGQIIALNVVFNGQFITYGIDMLQYVFVDEDVYGLRDFFTGGPEDLNNPMDFVFPKVTTCRFLNLGQGDVPNEFYFACVLPLNMFHDKFYLILWFWFLFLGILTGCQLVFDIMYATLPFFRKHLFIKQFGPILSESSKHPSSLPELFLLDLIGSNSDKFAFTTLLRKLNKEDWNPWNPAERQSLV